MKWTERYERQQQIGMGASARIYKVIRKDTREVLAAKIISVQSNASELETVEQQIKIISACTHKNVVKCLGIELYEGQVWILMEYCQGGSLADIMRLKQTTFKEQQISEIMKQVIEGLVYLHSKNIVHRDIKASNLLYHKGVVKIADFGVSIFNQKKSKTEGSYSRIGSPYWMSPEVLSDSIYNEKTDIWALGITAIELAEGEPPFSHQHPFRAIYSIQTHPPQQFSQPSRWSRHFNSFLKACLTVDYLSRPNATQLLKHPFICQNNMCAIQESRRSCMSNDSENTIIMHEEMPRSMWEGQSIPQSQQKMTKNESVLNETVIIREQNGEMGLPIVVLRQQRQSLNENLLTKSVIGQQNVRVSYKEQDAKVKQLYLRMQTQIKQIRRKYMKQIRKIYCTDALSKQNIVENSPVQNLKIKQSTGSGAKGGSLQMFSRIL